MVNGRVITKPSFDVMGGDTVTIRSIHNPYVSQGGLKLEHAIRSFSLSFEGKRVLDVGSSTGGFTDCALQHGASEVLAVDVGTLQLHGDLRKDERVILYENTNFLDIKTSDLPKEIDLVLVDVSFTSSLPIIKHAFDCLCGPKMVVLLKPQFETTERNRRGIVNNPKEHKSILKRYVQSLEGMAVPMRSLIPSPIKGQHGNIEFLLHIDTPTTPIDIDAIVDDAWSRD